MSSSRSSRFFFASLRAVLNRPMLILAFAAFVQAAGVGLPAPLVPTLKEQFLVNSATVALVFSAFGLARLIVDLPAGFLADRIPATRLLSVSLVLAGLSMAFSALAPGFEHLVAARVLGGVGSAVVATSILSVLTRLATAENRGTVMMLYVVSLTAGFSIHPALGSLAASALGWRATFGYGLILALLALALIRGLHLPRPEPARAASAGASALRLSHGQVLAIAGSYLLVFIFFLNHHGFTQTLIPLYAASGGLGPVAIGSILMITALVSLGSALVGGPVADRYGRTVLLLPGLAILALGDLILLSGPTYGALTLAAVGIGLSGFVHNLPSALLADSTPPPLLGKMIGGYRFFGDLGAVVGPVALGALFDAHGPAVPVVATAGLVVLAAVLTTFLIVRNPGRLYQPAWRVVA